MADYFVDKVKRFVDENGEKPFFLYYGLHQPHVPRAPHARFVGATGMGPRGDAIAEADWCVGEVIAYLKEKGLLENTVVIFTSDNGAVLNDGYEDGAVEMLGNHDPMNGLRGGKYSLFDGGTHVPMIVYWEGRVSAAVSDAFVSQLDFFASLGSLIDGNVPEGLDSEDVLPAFLGTSLKGREDYIIEAQGRLAYKSNDYVLIPPHNGPERNVTGNELGNLSEWGLYDLKSDPAQKNNLAPFKTELRDSLTTAYQLAISIK